MDTKIQSIICCPVCKGDVQQKDQHYICQDCQRDYPLVGTIPVFIENADRLAYTPQAYKEQTPVSEHDYSPRAQQIIAQCKHGLVLDLGSGGKDLKIDNVVQLDIFAFPNVDIVAYGEMLPFKDNSFDAVISQAVFEHLRYPEAVVKEIHRVCKSDAIVKIDTAFLQPLHGYPEHYYNATLSGLKRWFSYFDITWEGVENYQHPWLTFHWVMGVYLEGMSVEQKSFFLQQSIQDLMRTFECMYHEATPNDHPCITGLKDCLLALNKSKILELACGVSIEAKLRAVDENKMRLNTVADLEQDYRIRQLEAQVEHYKSNLKEKDDLLYAKNMLLKNKNEVIDYLILKYDSLYHANTTQQQTILQRTQLRLKTMLKKIVKHNS